MSERPPASAEEKPDASAQKPLRADAQRNRDKLVEMAAQAFAADGVDASLEEIAKRAGVGIGTLYRHFPTREHLVEVVYR
ncbi:MAG: helix-turn-helix transcriptional regulator, partial [Mesorhizobium sp.]